MLAGKCFSPLRQPWYTLLNNQQTHGNNSLCALLIKSSIDLEYVAYTKLSIAAQLLACLVPVGTPGLDLDTVHPSLGSSAFCIQRAEGPSKVKSSEMRKDLLKCLQTGWPQIPQANCCRWGSYLLVLSEGSGCGLLCSWQTSPLCFSGETDAGKAPVQFVFVILSFKLLWGSRSSFFVPLFLGEQVPLDPVDLCGYPRGYIRPLSQV